MGTLFISCLVFSFPSLYAALVCVACSQLEKLRLVLLEIIQTHGTFDQTDQQADEGHTHMLLRKC